MCWFIETQWECKHTAKTKADFCALSREGIPCDQSETNFNTEKFKCYYCETEDPKGTKGEASEEAEERKLEKWLESRSRDDLTLQVTRRWLQEQQRQKPEGEKMTEKTAEPHIRTDEDDI